MAVTVNIGHVINMTIAYLDTNGNPMLIPPTPDTPPVWTDSVTTVETVIAAPDGLTAVATPEEAGSDVISVTLSVDNVSYTATLAVTVAAAPQIFRTIQIVPTVV